MTNNEKYPLEVEVQVALIDSQYGLKGEVLRFSPSCSDRCFPKFFDGHDKRNLAVFASGSEIVYYDNLVTYGIISDRAIFDQNNVPVRILTYTLQE